MADEIRKLILDGQKDGKIVFLTDEGVVKCGLEEFVEQPLDGMLYDINRLESVILSFVDRDPRWVNDYALVRLLRYFYDKANENGERK